MIIKSFIAGLLVMASTACFGAGAFTFSLDDFSGGLNEKASSVLVKDTQATSLNNVSFDSYGAASKRNGYATVISSSGNTTATLIVSNNFSGTYVDDLVPIVTGNIFNLFWTATSINIAAMKFPAIAVSANNVSSGKLYFYVTSFPTTTNINVIVSYIFTSTFNTSLQPVSAYAGNNLQQASTVIGWNYIDITKSQIQGMINGTVYGLGLYVANKPSATANISRVEFPPYLEVTYITSQNNSVDKIHSYTTNSGTEYLYGNNTSNIFIASSQNNFVSTYAGITNKDQYSIQHNGLIYFTSTTNGLIVSNGTNTRLVDYTAAFNMLVTTYNAGAGLGLTAGSYYYKYSLVDDLGESYTSTASLVTINSTSEAVSISIYTNNTVSFNKFYIYRTLVNPSASTDNYYFVIPTTVTSSVKDTYVDATIQASGHFAPINKPPKSRFVYSLKNRLWLANTVTNNNMVFCSAALDPSSVYDSVLYWELDYPYDSSGQSNLFPLIGGAVTGMSDLFDSLLVFTPRSIFAGIGDDPSSATGFYMKKTSSLSGTRAPQSIAKADNTVYFLSEDNRIASFSSNGNRGLDSYTFDYLFADFIGDIIPNIVADIDYTYAPLSAGIFFKNKYYCSVPTSNTTKNVQTIVYENKLPAFSKFSIGASNFAIKNNELYFCSSSDGFSYKFNNAWSDASNTIPFLYQTKWLVLQDAYQQKKLQELWIKIKAVSGATLHYDVYTDFSETAKVSGNITTTGAGDYVHKVNGNDVLKVPAFKRIKFGISSNDTNEAQLQSIRGSYDTLKTPN